MPRGTDTFFYSRPDRLIGHAARHAIPTIYLHRSFGLAGGLMSYSVTVSTLDQFRRAAGTVVLH